MGGDFDDDNEGEINQLTRSIKRMQFVLGGMTFLSVGMVVGIIMSAFYGNNDGNETSYVVVAAVIACLMVMALYVLLVPGATRVEITEMKGGMSKASVHLPVTTTNMPRAFQIRDGTRHSVVEIVGEASKLGNMDVRVACGSPGDDIMTLIRKSVVGRNSKLAGPFGMRRITYMDYAASGRLLTFIEDYVRDVVAPLYANTHTETSYTGMQTSHFREEARNICSKTLDAPQDEYSVLFVGTGCTGAINKLMNVMGLWIPEQWKEHVEERLSEDERPVVLVGPYEHHSNDIMWRETICTVVVIPWGEDGHPDQAEIQRQMALYSHRPIKIGSFSGGSNVSGIVPPIEDITKLLHRGGFLSFWDMAGSGAYINFSMRPQPADPLTHVDAAFFSPHKAIGGPGCCGLLVAKRELFTNKIPTVAGGGTVVMVTRRWARFEEDPELLEDGGTPGILQAIRCGLVYRVKNFVGADNLEQAQAAHAHTAIQSWERNPAIRLVGSGFSSYKGRRTSTISFQIAYTQNGSTMLLHHNFVVQLLNDLYGIQARGGCSCAGPYAERLGVLGPATDSKVVDTFKEISSGHEDEHAIKPGWARVNFNYFEDELTVNFVIQAVHDIAESGYKLLPLYQMDVNSGMFYHRRFQHTDTIRLLQESRFDGGVEGGGAGGRGGGGGGDKDGASADGPSFVYRVAGHTDEDPTIYLATAQNIFETAHLTIEGMKDEIFEPNGDFMDGEPMLPLTMAMRWFILPSQVALDMGVTPPRGYTRASTSPDYAAARGELSTRLTDVCEEGLRGVAEADGGSGTGAGAGESSGAGEAVTNPSPASGAGKAVRFDLPKSPPNACVLGRGGSGRHFPVTLQQQQQLRQKCNSNNRVSMLSVADQEERQAVFLKMYSSSALRRSRPKG